jgi:phospholipase B1
MKFILLILAVVAAAGLANAGFNANTYKNEILKLARDPQFKNDFQAYIDDLLTLDPDYFNYQPFKLRSAQPQCNFTEFKSAERPTTVHELRPGDVQVVAALGDSISAALGADATTPVGLIYEYRGKSWTAGGANDISKTVSVPNILRQYNKDVFGYVTESNLVFLNKDGVGFNAAVSGAVASDIPKQARILVERMRASSKVDFQNDWKLVTLFIGGNDLCGFCDNRTSFSADAYVGHIQDALDILHSQMPRTFVNLVQLLKINEVKELNSGVVCKAVHSYVCPCIAFPKTDEQEVALKNELEQYKIKTQAMIDTGRYDDRDDFAVVVQPFFMDFSLPRLSDGKIDYSFLAPDCFHYSSKGHGRIYFSITSDHLYRIYH